MKITNKRWYKNNIFLLDIVINSWISVFLLIVVFDFFLPQPLNSQTLKNYEYINKLKLIKNPKGFLKSDPEFFYPVVEKYHYEASPIIIDKNYDIIVRTWRYSYNARGIIEMDNMLSGKKTILLIIHPWGIDDKYGWNTPKPAGTVFFGTPEKNRIYHEHIKKIVNPLIFKLRGKVAMICFSLPDKEDEFREKLYNHPSITIKKIKSLEQEYINKMKKVNLKGNRVIEKIKLSDGKETLFYFTQFRGDDYSQNYNGKFVRKFPVLLASELKWKSRDKVFYDGESYEKTRDFLKKKGIKNIILAGYALDLCVKSSTLGYKNLQKDFNIIIAGDATMAMFPAHKTPSISTSCELCKISLNHLITETSLIRFKDSKPK